MSTFHELPSVRIEPLQYEDLEWKPSAPQMHSRAEVRRQTGPYKAALPAVIEEWSPQMSTDLVADIEDATRSLVEFDSYAQRTLGTSNPALGPMSAILLRTESASSSQIEQLTTSAKQLALAEIDEGDKRNALTVIGNVRAMEAAVQLAGDLSEASVLAMHAALMSNQGGVNPVDAGEFRREQVWIGRGVAGPRQAEFVPPNHQHVGAAISDLIAFMQRDDLPALAQVAVAHAQFETIHPFTDGNGRTGRALAHSLLRNKGVTSSTTVPISAGLLVDVDNYFEGLGAFRRGDAGPIIQAFAQASRFAVVIGTDLIDGLAEQIRISSGLLKGVRSDATAWRVLPQLIAQPIVNTKYLVEQLSIGEMAALRALHLLAERGVLTESTGKARGRIWEHRGILNALDLYAEKLRRPYS